MAKKDYSEDLLIQAPTAEFLERELGWQSVLAYNEEDFGPDSLLGRQNDAEVVLTREVAAALKRLNPGLPETAYAQALAIVVQDDITKTPIQLNEEKYRLLRDGVPVTYRDAKGRLVDKRLRLIDFDRPEKNRYLAVRELWVRGKATAQAQVKAEIIKHLFANLPAGAYDADEINLKAGAVFAHIYSAGVGGGARVLH